MYIYLLFSFFQIHNISMFTYYYNPIMDFLLNQSFLIYFYLIKTESETKFIGKVNDISYGVCP